MNQSHYSGGGHGHQAGDMDEDPASVLGASYEGADAQSATYHSDGTQSVDGYSGQSFDAQDVPYSDDVEGDPIDEEVQAEQPKPKSKIRPIMLGVLALLTVGAVGGAIWYVDGAQKQASRRASQDVAAAQNAAIAEGSQSSQGSAPVVAGSLQGPAPDATAAPAPSVAPQPGVTGGAPAPAGGLGVGSPGAEASLSGVQGAAAQASADAAAAQMSEQVKSLQARVASLAAENEALAKQVKDLESKAAQQKSATKTASAKPRSSSSTSQASATAATSGDEASGDAGAAAAQKPASKTASQRSSGRKKGETVEQVQDVVLADMSLRAVYPPDGSNRRAWIIEGETVHTVSVGSVIRGSRVVKIDQDKVVLANKAEIR